MAFEYDEVVLRTRISSGFPSSGPSPNGIPTETPSGDFHVEIKTPSRHMGDGSLPSDLEAYELPGLPGVSFFHSTGVGFHGTYWHTDFGRARSHGCVNMRTEEAKWIYRWTMPLSEPDRLLISGPRPYVAGDWSGPPPPRPRRPRPRPPPPPPLSHTRAFAPHAFRGAAHFMSS